MYQADFWARANGCGGDRPELSESPDVRHWRYDCPGGAPVELYVVREGGHAWPGGERGSVLGDRPSDALDATEVIWGFFETSAR